MCLGPINGFSGGVERACVRGGNSREKCVWDSKALLQISHGLGGFRVD